MFQFPSNGKVYSKDKEVPKDKDEKPPTFQFPSNGKVYSKIFFSLDLIVLRVMFQFPSNGKVYSKLKRPMPKTMTMTPSFNSLQTGKCIARPRTRQVPRTETKVSIPFKRESVLQGGDDDPPDVTIGKVFQFPSNGKVYCKRALTSDGILKPLKFQFPSNGKVYCKFVIGMKRQFKI